MTSGGKCGFALLTAALVLIGTVGLTAPTASARDTGAHMGSGRDQRVGAVRCTGDLTTGPRPVLLVHGTGLTAAENWSGSYLPALVADGRAVCTVSLPATAVGDVQTNAEYVATAIREVHTRAGRRIAVLGHSQGAMLPRLALRVWPDLAARVDDVIGLAGVYDRGSSDLVRRCETECVPAMHQMATGSRLLRAVGRRALPAGPAGPSYTNIGALGDLTVTPQPAANQQAGATAVAVQDVCPGREIPVSEHAMIIGDAVAKALVDDALEHAGAAVAARIDTATCDEVYYPGFVPEPFLDAASSIRARLRPTTPSEAPVRCYLRPTCSDASGRGRLLEGARVEVTRRSVTWTGRVPLDGRVRVSFRGSSYVRRVRPGSVTLRVDRPRGARGTMVLSTMPDRYSVWAREGSARLR
jgi:triacylglycerol lipase